MPKISHKRISELSEDQLKAYNLIGLNQVSVQTLHDQYKKQLHWSYDILARHLKDLYDFGLINRDWQKVNGGRCLIYWKKET